jgi:Transcriptional regulator PadR-like family
MAEVLGGFEQAVLLALVRLADEGYGRAILKEVQERLARDVAAGAVHATLVRLEAKGLIASRLGAGHDPHTLRMIEASGGLSEVFLLPVVLIVPGTLCAIVGGLVGKGLAWIGRSRLAE